MRSGVEGIPWKHGPPARDTSARAGVTAFGPGRWCDEHNLVGSAALGCINGHPGQAKRKSRLDRFADGRSHSCSCLDTHQPTVAALLVPSTRTTSAEPACASVWWVVYRTRAVAPCIERPSTSSRSDTIFLASADPRRSSAEYALDGDTRTRREDTVGCGHRGRARACRDRGARGVVGSRAEWGSTPGGNATPPHLSWQRRPGGAAHRGRTNPDAGDRSRRSCYARSPAV